MYANVAAGEIAALGGGGVYVGLGIADLARTYDFSENGTIIKVEEGNVVVSEFLRFKEDGGREAYTAYAKKFEKMVKDVGGYVALSVNAEFPIVSHEYCDHFVSIVFPSRDVMVKLLRSDEFLVINPERLNSLDGAFGGIQYVKLCVQKAGPW